MYLEQPQLTTPRIAGLLPAPPVEIWDGLERGVSLLDAFDDHAPLPPRPEMDFNPGQSGRGADPVLFEVPDTRSFWKLHTMPLYLFGKFVPSPVYDGMHAPWRPEWRERLSIRLTNYRDVQLPGRGEFTCDDPVGCNSLGDGSVRLPRSPQPGEVIEIDSYWPQPSPTDLASHPVQRGAVFTGPQEVAKLALSRFRSAPNLAELYDQILEFFRDGFTYSRNGFPISTSPLETFLFDTHVGNCQHFSGTTVLILQALGIVSRVVGGFAAETTRIKGGSAHAWVEVFVPTLGWITLDPTNDAGLERDDLDPEETQGEDDPDMGDDYEPPKEEPVEFFSDEFEDVDPWARQFAMGAKRIIALIYAPRVAGAYETGTRVNTSRLYAMQTGDPRFYKRRTQPKREPAVFLYGQDESASVREFEPVTRRLYDRVRYMLSEGLNRAQQDFAVFGWHTTIEVYKALGDPFGDVHRERLLRKANARIGGGNTHTDSAVAKMRDLAKPLGGQKTVGLLLTDGVPFHPGQDDTPAKVREQVDLAHGENVHVIALVYANPHQDEHDLLRDLEGMFDRYILLSRDETEVNEQLTHTLISLLRKA